MIDRRDRWLIAFVFCVYLILAAVLPPAEDEFYYWAWSKELQLSYYDHPLMTAYLIRLSTSLFGDSVFGFRLPACFASAFVLFVIALLSRSRGLLLWIAFTPLFTLGAVIITPDTPLLLFWAAYVWWLVEVHRRLTPVENEGLRSTATVSTMTLQPALPLWLWLLGGILLGAGVLSKYTMALAVPAGFSSFAWLSRRWREWLPGYVLHGVISFVVASPILIYNINQDFAPLLFQWHHSMGQTQPGLKPFAEFVGIQILLFGTLPFFLFPWVIWNVRRLAENPRLRVCVCLYAIPLTFFLFKATRSPLEGNWALVSFVAFWPLAATWYASVNTSRFWRWSAASAFIPPVVCVIGLSLHLIHPLSVIPIRGDRISRQAATCSAVCKVAEHIRARGEELPVYTPRYQLTAMLRFQGLNAQQIDGITRPSHFTQRPQHLTDVDRAYVVSERPLPEEFSPGFNAPELIADFPIIVRGELSRTLFLWRYSMPAVAKVEAHSTVTPSPF